MGEKYGRKEENKCEEGRYAEGKKWEQGGKELGEGEKMKEKRGMGGWSGKMCQEGKREKKWGGVKERSGLSGRRREGEILATKKV